MLRFKLWPIYKSQTARLPDRYELKKVLPYDEGEPFAIRILLIITV